jgi:hypothetical protein
MSKADGTGDPACMGMGGDGGAGGRAHADVGATAPVGGATAPEGGAPTLEDGSEALAHSATASRH